MLNRLRWWHADRLFQIKHSHWLKPQIYHYMEKAMAPHSSTLAWKTPWMEEPGRPQSMGSLRIGHNWGTSLSLFTFMHWRRKWQPTPVFLPGESQGRRNLVGCRLWGRRVGHNRSDLAAAAAAYHYKDYFCRSLNKKRISTWTLTFFITVNSQCISFLLFCFVLFSFFIYFNFILFLNFTKLY